MFQLFNGVGRFYPGSGIIVSVGGVYHPGAAPALRISRLDDATALRNDALSFPFQIRIGIGNSAVSLDSHLFGLHNGHISSKSSPKSGVLDIIAGLMYNFR